MSVLVNARVCVSVQKRYGERDRSMNAVNKDRSEGSREREMERNLACACNLIIPARANPSELPYTFKYIFVAAVAAAFAATEATAAAAVATISTINATCVCVCIVRTDKGVLIRTSWRCGIDVDRLRVVSHERHEICVPTRNNTRKYSKCMHAARRETLRDFVCARRQVTRERVFT